MYKKIAYILSLTAILTFPDAAIAELATGPAPMAAAMQDEMARSMDRLSLEKLQRPFFMSYLLSDARTLHISASLGAIVSSETVPYRRAQVRLLVGDYRMSNENFMDAYGGWGYGADLPLEDSYNGIRRALWDITDNRYKDAAETFERKLSAISQQTLAPEDTALPDLAKAPQLMMEIQTDRFAIDRARWEETARELSAIFKQYPGIFTSDVSVYLIQTTVYLLNSEGTRASFPVALALVRATAETQALEGEPLKDQISFYGTTPDDLPPPRQMRAQIEDMARRLTELRTAPLFEESYSGPVLFEGQAVAELFAQRFFGGRGGLADKRKVIMEASRYSSKSTWALENPLESRMGKKIISRELFIRDVPGLKRFGDQSLIGGFAVDAEGVTPPPELVLVDRGVLKTFLNGRTPTQKVRESNGHRRIAFAGNGVAAEIGPGVIEISSSKTKSLEKLRKTLIAKAKDEDLDYAYIIRKVDVQEPGYGDRDKPAGVKPLYIYRVSTKDGSEALVRSADMDAISLSALKRVLGSADQQYAYNTMLGESQGGWWRQGWDLDGIPASFIVPRAVLFEELDLEREKRAVTVKLPAVPSPLGQ